MTDKPKAKAKSKSPVSSQVSLPEIPNIPINFYSAQVGCWNCDTTYTIDIPNGTVVPQYIGETKIFCLGCGCNTLKMLAEYKIEKEIMKEIILHNRTEHTHNHEEEVDDDFGHYQ
jgi:hypothetical protein